MPALPPPDDRHCHAGPGCHRPPGFRAELYRPIRVAGQTPPAKTLDTCSGHLADTIQAMTEWASKTGFGSSLLEVSAVDTVDGAEGRSLIALPFATISLPA